MKGKKILVADDEPHILKSLRVVLEEAGYEVLTATDGETALRTAQKERPALCIFDVQMSRMNGHEVYDRLQHDPFQRETPVIILTAFGFEERRNEHVPGRSLTLVAKPFSPYAILNRVTEILGKSCT